MERFDPGLAVAKGLKSPAPKIEIRGVTRLYEGATRDLLAVDGAELTIARGEFVCLVGPSGCGKTTILRMLGGLDHPSSGTISVHRDHEGGPLSSIVFQEQSVFPWYTVQANVEYGLRMRGVPRAQRREKASEFIDKVGLSGFADSYPHELSGGMKQRVSIARAFANDAEILLMDEPFAALDEQNKILLQEELLRIWEEERKTVLFITHSIDEALALGDRVVVMTARPGRIKASIPVTFARPRRIYDLKTKPEFGAAVREIWDLLRDEVLNAQRQLKGKGQ